MMGHRMSTLSFTKDKIKVLLLEKINPVASEIFHNHGYTNIEVYDQALSDEAFLEKIQQVHILGIRSRTDVNAQILQQAKKLIAIGCFCIGTNQVDLACASELGIPVFNAPFANTRSVAELVLGEIILLLRQIPEKNAHAHRGIWHKSIGQAVEARGKKLGIIGYGHIGTQLGILAESLGMEVYFHDIEHKLPLGNAKAVDLPTLLATCDVVSLHVPQTPQTHHLINANTLQQMRQGSVLINASRGQVVDLQALHDALASKHISGAALDVFPVEPSSNEQAFKCLLQGMHQVILTPHIGGSTQEAQRSIGIEVAEKLLRFSDNGSTLCAVNFPEVNLPMHASSRRILHIHENRPGIMNQINQLFATHKINIVGQYLQTSGHLGYVVTDIQSTQTESIMQAMHAIDGTIRTRLLHNIKQTTYT